MHAEQGWPSRRGRCCGACQKQLWAGAGQLPHVCVQQQPHSRSSPASGWLAIGFGAVIWLAFLAVVDRCWPGYRIRFLSAPRCCPCRNNITLVRQPPSRASLLSRPQRGQEIQCHNIERRIPEILNVFIHESKRQAVRPFQDTTLCPVAIQTLSTYTNTILPDLVQYRLADY